MLNLFNLFVISVVPDEEGGRFQIVSEAWKLLTI